MGIPISLLDFDAGFVFAPEVGPYVEELGYQRYWFGEHPPQPNAELFVALLAGLTSRLRIGTGGVLLRLRNVFQSAMNFRFLVDAFGLRIDAGFCAGHAETPELNEALCEPGSFSNSYEEYVSRVDRWTHLLRSRSNTPVPEVWSLGTSVRSARKAASLGVHYAYSVFHSASTADPSALETYRESFRPSEFGAAPRTMVAFAGLAAPTEAEAQKRLQSAVPVQLVPQPDGRLPVLCGNKGHCAEQLAQVLRRYRPDEVMLCDVASSLPERLESVRLWAEIAASQ
jgi:alkanesulfonate monooxygenase SsuD/methylene tetrahydromethanopterin reductase-like flavin-dependent oxidoreductase (luciferase family)